MYNRIIKLSIYLLVFLLPLFFLPFSFEAFEFNKQYLLFFLVSVGLFFWIAKMVLVDKEIRFKRSPLDIFILAFLFIAILSAIFSVDKSSSLFGFYGRFSDGLIGLLSLGIFYFLIINNVFPSGEPPINADKRRSKLIDDSFYFRPGFAEINQKTDSETGCLEIIQALCIMVFIKPFCNL